MQKYLFLVELLVLALVPLIFFLFNIFFLIDTIIKLDTRFALVILYYIFTFNII